MQWLQVENQTFMTKENNKRKILLQREPKYESLTFLIAANTDMKTQRSTSTATGFARIVRTGLIFAAGIVTSSSLDAIEPIRLPAPPGIPPIRASDFQRTSFDSPGAGDSSVVGQVPTFSEQNPGVVGALEHVANALTKRAELLDEENAKLQAALQAYKSDPTSLNHALAQRAFSSFIHQDKMTRLAVKAAAQAGRDDLKAFTASLGQAGESANGLIREMEQRRESLQAELRQVSTRLRNAGITHADIEAWETLPLNKQREIALALQASQDLEDMLELIDELSQQGREGGDELQGYLEYADHLDVHLEILQAACDGGIEQLRLMAEAARTTSDFIAVREMFKRLVSQELKLVGLPMPRPPKLNPRGSPTPTEPRSLLSPADKDKVRSLLGLEDKSGVRLSSTE